MLDEKTDEELGYTKYDDKILSMYAKGMTTGDIEFHVKELCDVDAADSATSRITDRTPPGLWAEPEIDPAHWQPLSLPCKSI